MRWMIIASLLGLNSLWATPIHKTIDELLDNEKEQALSIPKYDPFKRAKPLLKRKKSGRSAYKPQPSQLTAVMNDKAFINGNWYTKGESIPEGKLVKINRTSVYLKKGKKIKILPLKKSKNLLEISQKGEK